MGCNIKHLLGFRQAPLRGSFVPEPRLNRHRRVTVALDRERVFDSIRQEWRRAWGNLSGLREAARRGELVVREAEAQTGRRLSVPTIALPVTTEQWEAVATSGPEWCAALPPSRASG